MHAQSVLNAANNDPAVQPPLRIKVRKWSAPKVAGFCTATQPQNTAAWPNIAPPPLWKRSQIPLFYQAWRQRMELL